MSSRPILEIPVSAAKEIADRYGYDQVVIIARRVGDEPEPHGEHVTTYGRDKAHCSVAARVGNFIKHKIMGWPEYEAAPQAQADARDAARWRESLSHVYSATKGNGQPIFGISLAPSESLYRSKLTSADQFTKDIDAAIAAAKGK